MKKRKSSEPCGKPERRSYKKPEIKSEQYQERAGLACNKMYGTSPRCNANSAIS